MKVFIILMTAICGLGFMRVVDVMAKPATYINGSAFTNKTMQAYPHTNNTDLSLSGKDAKKRSVRKAKIKKKYRVDKKKLLLILSILRKRK